MHGQGVAPELGATAAELGDFVKPAEEAALGWVVHEFRVAAHRARLGENGGLVGPRYDFRDFFARHEGFEKLRPVEREYRHSLDADVLRDDEQVALGDVRRAHYLVRRADERAHDDGAVVAVVEFRVASGHRDTLRAAFFVDFAHYAPRALFAYRGRQNERDGEICGVAALRRDVVGIYSDEQTARSLVRADYRVGREDEIFSVGPAYDRRVLADAGADEDFWAARAYVREHAALERLRRQLAGGELMFFRHFLFHLCDGRISH